MKEPKKNLINAFGKRLRQLRKERGWSQEKLALKADCNCAYIGLVERGEKSISLRVIDRVAKAMGLSPMEFFVIEEHHSNNTIGDKVKETAGYLVETSDDATLKMIQTVMEGFIQARKKEKTDKS